MIAIIDYGAGNLLSVSNAIKKLGYDPVITSSIDDVLHAAAVILPGVGAAGDTMSNLVKLGMDKVIKKLVSENRPLFAVCVGMQVLFSGTEEGGWHECMGILPGMVKKLPPGLKVPHMGWNQLKQVVFHPIFNNIPDETYFYFVHSYYCDPEDISVTAATTDYGVTFCSAIIKGNLIATQFHPEKSGIAGLTMYSNFITMALKDRGE